MEQTEVDLDAFVEHFTKVHRSWHNSPMQICSGDCPRLPVSKKEVIAAVGRLKSGKSAGNCSYPIDFAKCHKDGKFYDALTVLCSALLNSGIPNSLNSMLIMPLYKSKGSKLDPNNYRGISLIHPLGKLLAAIVLGKLEVHA